MSSTPACKVTGNIFAATATDTDLDTDPDTSTKKVLVVDCGTGECKALLFQRFPDGTINVAEMRIFAPVLSFINEGRSADLVNLVVALAKDAQEGHHGSCPRIALGLSAWFRDLLADTSPRGAATKDIVEQVLAQIASQLMESDLTMVPIMLSDLDEAKFEAIAVSYAATHSGLPPTDVVVGSGGGSIQFSYRDPEGNTLSYSIPIGFRRGIELMKKNIRACDQWDNICHDTIAKFMAMHGLTPNGGNCVGISACFYGWKLVCIGDVKKAVSAADVKKAFKDKQAELRAMLTDEEAMADEDLKKQTIKDLSNATIQRHLFSVLLADEAQVNFGRDWVVNGQKFRTTWSTGWSMDNC